MNLREWYFKYPRGEYSDAIPVFVIDDNNKADEIVVELQKLGMFDGNMCAKLKDTNYIDIWYSDFYNTFHIYTMHEENFIASLKELRELNTELESLQ